MRKTLMFFAFLSFVSANVFADDGDLVILNLFPEDGVMQENHVYKNSAVFQNIGVYDGTIEAIAMYDDIPLYCEPGYYLPENASECEICPENHFCVGGDHAVKEACESGLVSPTGTTDSLDCGKILHVGEDIMYLTQKSHSKPSLAVQIDGKTYYASATKASEGSKPMNVNTTRVFKLLYKNVEYVVHDITVK